MTFLFKRAKKGMIFMKKIEYNISRKKKQYDDLIKKEYEIKQQKEEVERKIKSLKEIDKHKPLLVRLFKKIFERIAEMLNIPTRKSREMENLQRQITEAYDKLKDIRYKKCELDNGQTAFESLEDLSQEQVNEYTKKVSNRANAISELKLDKKNNPSRIVDEFKTIIQDDNPINKYKILDYVFAKKDFIDDFHEKYINNALSQNEDLENEEMVMQDIYSDEVDIKDIESALSFILNEDVSFDWYTAHFIGENFECTVGGELIGEYDTNSPMLREAVMVMKEYGEVIAQTIREIAKEKHPDLLNFTESFDFKKSYKNNDKGKNIGKGHSFKQDYKKQKEDLSKMSFCKSYFDSDICKEYYTTLNGAKDKHPEKIMDYLFAKEADISVKDIEAVVSYSVQTPVHFDFSSKTFKSALWEIDAKGSFMHSEELPSKECRKLSRFFKQYGEKSVSLLFDIAKKQQPSLLTDNKTGIAVSKEFTKTTCSEVFPESSSIDTGYHGDTMKIDDYDDIDDLIDSVSSEEQGTSERNTIFYDDLEL